MKVIHLSDLHIGIGSVMGSNPVEHLRSVLTHVTRFHADASRYVITGGLVDRGVHVVSSDSIGLTQMTQFKALITKHASTIRHIFFGHCHFTLSGNVHGVPLAAPRSIHENLWPYLERQEARFATGPLERNYNVCFIETDTTIIHTVDYEKYSRIRLL